MAYTYRSTGTESRSTGAMSPGAPAGLTNGDLMLLVVGCRASAQTQTATLTGWTEIFSDNTSLSRYVYAHIADGVNDSPSPEMSGTSKGFASIDAFYGGGYTDFGTILLTSDTESGTSQAILMPSVTTPSEDNLLLYAVGFHSTLNETGASISETTEFTLTGNSGGNTSDIDVAVGYWIQTTATSYDGDNFTISGSPESRAARGNILQLKSQSATINTVTINTGQKITVTDGSPIQ